MPDLSSTDDFTIKLQEYRLNANHTVQGIFLSNNEYALLRGVPPQTIIEENGLIGNRRPFRKTKYLKDEKKVFIYLEKPLYTHIDAKIFRLEKLHEGQELPIVEHEEEKIKGYWIDKKSYLDLTLQNFNTLTKNLQKDKVEFGQIYKRLSKGYTFFIPIEPDLFTVEEVKNFILALQIKKLKINLKKIESFNISTEATKFSKILKANPKLMEFLHTFATSLDSEQINFICTFAEDFTKDDLNLMLEASKGMKLIFGDSTNKL